MNPEDMPQGEGPQPIHARFRHPIENELRDEIRAIVDRMNDATSWRGDMRRLSIIANTLHELDR